MWWKNVLVGPSPTLEPGINPFSGLDPQAVLKLINNSVMHQPYSNLEVQL
jgi:hypothetical protein